MKTQISILLVMAILVISVLPAVIATDVGTGVGVTINTEKFKPMLFQCDGRTAMDDNTQNGANSISLSERKNNYAFEGESIHWTVLAVDKNKIEAITDVVGTIGPTQGTGNDVQVECKRLTGNIDGETTQLPTSCGAKILEEDLSWNEDIMAFYDCALTVETPASMHGEYFLTVEAQTEDAGSAIMAENEFWFLNPTIALSTDGTLTFDNVRPGTNAYSDTMLVRNDAEAGSGVMLDMFISGTDFYDSSSSGARCSKDNNGIVSNRLNLDTFRYYVTNGAYSSSSAAVKAAGETDAQGYTSIPTSTDISGAKRIMRYNTVIRGASPSSSVVDTDWNNGNALTPGAEMALTFKLSMPEPCTGNFDSGSIFFWGEAI